MPATADSGALELRLGLTEELGKIPGLARVDVVVLDTSRLQLLCRVLASES